MKKIRKSLALLTALLVLLPVFAQAESELPVEDNTTVITETASETEPEPQPEPEPEPAPETPSEPAPQPEEQPDTPEETPEEAPDETPSETPEEPTEPLPPTGEAEGNPSDEEVGDSVTGGEDDSTEGDASEDDEEEKPEATKKPSSSKKSSSVSYAKARTEAVFDGVTVSVEELGTIHTKIKQGDQQDYVLTSMLDFKDVDETQLQMAYVVAPKTGRAAMRDRAAKNETIIRYCDAGDLVIVLGSDEEFTHILYKGTKGYVLNDTLQMVEIPEEDGEYAELSVDGRTDGNALVNIRNLPDRNSCKIQEWRIGTEVTVWNLTDGWYEIEAAGVRGFVMEAYVTIDPGV